MGRPSVEPAEGVREQQRDCTQFRVLVRPGKLSQGQPSLSENPLCPMPATCFAANCGMP